MQMMAFDTADTNGGCTDPLIAEAHGALRLTEKPATTAQTRERRRSDADRPLNSVSRSDLPVHSVRSRDGTRWLPTPQEQVHTVGVAACKSEPVLPQPECLPSQALEPHQCSRDATGCAMLRTFDIPELFELILTFLDTRNILTLRRTSQRWLAALHESPYLRLHMFVHPNWCLPSPDFTLLPLTLAGLEIERKEAVHLGQWIRVSMTRETAQRIAPDHIPRKRLGRSRSIFEGLRGGLGSKAEGSKDAWPALPPREPNPTLMIRLEDLYITQPPIVSVQAFRDIDDGIDELMEPDDLDHQETIEPMAKLSCDAGITLGFLAQTALTLLESEPFEDTLVFKAIVSFGRSENAPRKRLGTRHVARFS